MQYFTQAFTCRQPYPDKYDLLMDVATEEFGHLEIVGATITMLLEGVNGELKNAAEQTVLTGIVKNRSEREELIHQAATSPAFLVLSAAASYMPGSFMPASLRAKLAFPMSLNILRICAYWRSSWLTS
jgi:manganese catalase